LRQAGVYETMAGARAQAGGARSGSRLTGRKNARPSAARAPGRRPSAAAAHRPPPSAACRPHPMATPTAPPATPLLPSTGVAALALFVGIAWWLAPLSPGALALQFAYTPRSFGAIVHVWPPEHLARYRAHLPADMLLLACYGTFGWLLATRGTLLEALPRRARRVAAWLLPLAAAFDAAENALHAWLTAAPRFGVAPLYVVSAACSSAKWLLMLGFAALVLAAVARRED